jgi:flagellar motor protein MotB
VSAAASLVFMALVLACVVVLLLADRLTTVGYGSTRPKEPNDTLEGRARNRRVELVRL